jgi:hypothetical protein
MNRPANILPPIVQRYGGVLDALRPDCGEIERRRRCGIPYLRDRATAPIRVAGWESIDVADVVVLRLSTEPASLHRIDETLA